MTRFTVSEGTLFRKVLQENTSSFGKFFSTYSLSAGKIRLVVAKTQFHHVSLQSWF